MARIVKSCRDLPGYELFQYLDDAGERHTVSSTEVNAYLREITGEDITAKDFRTWAATNLAALALQEFVRVDSEAKRKRAVVRTVERVFLCRYRMTDIPKPPFPPQQQPVPGASVLMTPRPDHGEDSYRGIGGLHDKKVLLTGGDSGIGRAVAITFAREGADILIAYLDEDDDARETQRLVEEAGRQCVLAPGDIAKPGHCRKLVEKAMGAFERIDVLVNNAAHQMTFNSLDRFPTTAALIISATSDTSLRP
jgi:hypothetical protein